MVELSSPRPKAEYAEWPIKIRELTVLARAMVTPRMLRLTLGGAQMEGFESHLPDEHVKLVFPDPETGVTRAPVPDGDHLDWPRPFPPAREYTIRRYDRRAGTVELDFVVHSGGLASTWAQECAIGSTIWVAGPRPSIEVPRAFGFLVLLADETGLPAVGRWLEEWPAGTRGVVAVEIEHADDEQDLPVPDGVTLTWLHRSAAPGDAELLARFAEAIELPSDVHTYVWAGAEAISLKPVRRWARGRGHTKYQSDISGYWRRGLSHDDLERPSLLDHARHAIDHLLRREH